MADAPLFLAGSLLRHVTVMSLTASIGLMAMFAVDFVDVVFIAMIGNAALAAAVGYAGTVLFFTTSIGIGLSIAAGSLTAQAVGRGHSKDARGYATTTAILGVLVGIAVPLLLLPFMPELLGALGAEGEVARLAERYLAIILPTMPILAVAMTAMAVLRAHGDARRAMTAPLVAGVVNAVFDPILIFGLGLGLDGAAIATVLSRFALLGATLHPAFKVHRGFAWPTLGRLRADLRPAAAIAIPAVLANIATPVGNAIVTREVARFGTEAVAGYAVIGRLTPLAFAVVFALSGAIGPIIGQNFGAGRLDRVRAAFNAAVVFTALYVAVATLALFLLREPIVQLFEAEGEARRLILLFCGPLALATFFNGVIFVANASFNNLGHPSYSTAINWGRHTLGTWPFAVAGATLWGAAGALVGQAVGGVIFAALAAWLAFRAMRQRPVALPGPFAHQARWQSLFARHK